LRGIKIDSSDSHENASDSIRVKCEFDSSYFSFCESLSAITFQSNQFDSKGSLKNEKQNNDP
jgi:hypothetical protein